MSFGRRQGGWGWRLLLWAHAFWHNLLPLPGQQSHTSARSRAVLSSSPSNHLMLKRNGWGCQDIFFYSCLPQPAPKQESKNKWEAKTQVAGLRTVACLFIKRKGIQRIILWLTFANFSFLTPDGPRVKINWKKDQFLAIVSTTQKDSEL